MLTREKLGVLKKETLILQKEKMCPDLQWHLWSNFVPEQ